MFKTTVRVKGFFDDEPKTYTLYFNLSRREMWEFIKSYDNVTNFREMIETAQKNGDHLTLIEFIDNLLGSAYGERQGDKFVKDPIIRANFLDGPQYEEMFNRMIASKSFSQSVIEGIMPQAILDEVRKDPKYQAEFGTPADD